MRVLIRSTLLAAAYAVVSACGGGGGGGDTASAPPPAPVASTTVSGTVSDDPLSGANVEIRSLSGSVLGSTRSDTAGAYSLSVPSASLQSGFLVVASGGTSGGRAFSGELRAAYSSSDSPSAANATLITSLVMLLADRETTGADLLAKRNAVLDRLATNTVIARNQWNAVSPTNVALDSLRADVNARGFSTTLTAIADELSASALVNPGERVFRVFPATLGGVVGLAYGAAVLPIAFEVFAGDAVPAVAATVAATSAAGSTRQFSLVNPPAGMTIDSATGALTYRVAAGTTAPVPFTLRVTTPAGSRQFLASVQPIVGTEIAIGTATGALQVIGDTLGQFKVATEPGGLAAGTTISISRGMDASGQLVIKLSGDKPLADASKVRLTLAEPDIAFDGRISAPAAAGISAREKLATPLDPTFCGQLSSNEATSSPFPYLWYIRYGWFLGSPVVLTLNGPTPSRLGSYRIPLARQNEIQFDTFQIPDGATSWTFTVKRRPDAVLCGASPSGDFLAVEPIVFVHGYTAFNNLGATQNGSSNETFGEFPQRLRSSAEELLSPRQFRPFIFRWITNQKFEDAASGLNEALSSLSTNAKTRKIHVVAHSFGGVLVRTYLQGLAGNFSYDRPVSTVTSFGSPYSGIFPVRGTTPSGYDGGAGVAGQVGGNQLTVHQMGDPIAAPAGLLESRFDARLGEITDRLKNLKDNPIIPADLSYFSMIGLGVTFAGRFSPGDALISFWGQRFQPDDFGLQEPLRRAPPTATTARVTEYVLGVESPSISSFFESPERGAPVPGRFPGYAHNVTSFFDLARANCYEVEIKKDDDCPDPLSPTRDARINAVVRNMLQMTTAPPFTPPDPVFSSTVNFTVAGPAASAVSVRVSAPGIPDVTIGDPVVSGASITIAVRFRAATTYRATFTAPGFVSTQRSFTLAGIGTFDLGRIELTSVTATRPALYLATVRSSSTGAAIVGAAWSMVCGGTVYGSGTSEVFGTFGVGGLPRTQCNVSTSAPGYVSASSVVSFAVSNFVETEIRLDPVVAPPTVLIDSIGSGTVQCGIVAVLVDPRLLPGNPAPICGGALIGSPYPGTAPPQRVAIALDWPATGTYSLSQVSLVLAAGPEVNVTLRAELNGGPDLSSSLASQRASVPDRGPAYEQRPTIVTFNTGALVPGRRYWLELSPAAGSTVWVPGPIAIAGTTASGIADGRPLTTAATSRIPGIRVTLANASSVPPAIPPVVNPLGPVTYDVTARLQFATPSLQAWNALGWGLTQGSTIRAVLSYDPATASTCGEATGFVRCDWSTALKVLEIYAADPAVRFSASVSRSAATELLAGGSLAAFVGTGRIAGQNALFIGSFQLRKFNDPQFNARVLPTVFAPLGEYSLKTLNLQSSDPSLIGYTLSADIESVTRR